MKRTASQREIKRSWRRLALLLHPDKIGPNATEKQRERFADASSAYEVLSDPERRRAYDDTGDTGASGASASGQDRDYTANGGVEVFVHFPKGGFRFRRTCGGTGKQVHLGYGPGGYRHAARIKCPVCSGAGTIIGEPCKVCHGHHTVETMAELNFTAPAGALDGQVVVLQHQGHQAWRHAHGDGVLVVRRAQHKVFLVS